MLKNERRDCSTARSQVFARQRAQSLTEKHQQDKISVVIQSVIAVFAAVKNDFKISDIEFFYLNMSDIKENFVMQSKKC